MQAIHYTELTPDAVTASTISSLNRLLPQLSPDIKPLNREWLEYILANNTRIFIALDGDRIVGTALLCSMVILVGQKDWIEDVVVDRAYRGKGIASRLMDIAESASRQSPAKNINLTSSSHREGARGMYVKRGYKLRDTSVFRLER
ncbi:MAG TPA: GNAT family N-acetyltransferase [Candidatus Saccharimonadales bacterium]|nr:GNAT family N-acetyltransferase [Candidatus Saccharimonadales bacterium]